jgi:hypothetical protein
MNVFTPRAADLLALAQRSMTTARPASTARHGPSLAALTQPTTADTPRGADLHLLLTHRPEGSGEHTAGGSAGLHPAVPGGAPG